MIDPSKLQKLCKDEVSTETGSGEAGLVHSLLMRGLVTAFFYVV